VKRIYELKHIEIVIYAKPTEPLTNKDYELLVDDLIKKNLLRRDSSFAEQVVCGFDMKDIYTSYSGSGKNLKTHISYRGIVLWHEQRSLEQCIVYLARPDAAHSFYRLVCIDEKHKVLTYGKWESLVRADEWLRHPVDLD